MHNTSSSLLDFGLRRTPREALAFYVFYLVLIIVVAGVIGGGSAVVFGTGTEASGENAGRLAAITCSLLLSFAVIAKKQLWAPLPLLLAVLSGVLGYFGGALLGVLPATYLTMLPPFRPARREKI